jgi:hypothetical protein
VTRRSTFCALSIQITPGYFQFFLNTDPDPAVKFSHQQQQVQALMQPIEHTGMNPPGKNRQLNKMESNA